MKNSIKDLFHQEVLLEGQAYIKNNSNDLYLMEIVKIINNKLAKLPRCSFQELYQISLGNLRKFWLEILYGFEHNYITDEDILDIIDCFETYIYGRYEDKSPTDNDALSIGKNAIQFIKEGVWTKNLSSDVIAKLINYLNTPYGKEWEANQCMEKYIASLRS